MTVEEDCPICNSSSNTKHQFATAKVAEYSKGHARSHDGHRAWIEVNTATGTLAQIREGLESCLYQHRHVVFFGKGQTDSPPSQSFLEPDT